MFFHFLFISISFREHSGQNQWLGLRSIFLIAGKVVWLAGIVMILGQFVGAWCGSHCLFKMNPNIYLKGNFGWYPKVGILPLGNCLGVHHICAGAPEESPKLRVQVPLGCRLENYSGSYVNQLDRAEMGCS